MATGLPKIKNKTLNCLMKSCRREAAGKGEEEGRQEPLRLLAYIMASYCCDTGSQAC